MSSAARTFQNPFQLAPSRTSCRRACPCRSISWQPCAVKSKGSGSLDSLDRPRGCVISQPRLSRWLPALSFGVLRVLRGPSSALILLVILHILLVNILQQKIQKHFLDLLKHFAEDPNLRASTGQAAGSVGGACLRRGLGAMIQVLVMSR